MKKVYLKIITLFFLTVLLTSNILNLHVLFNHDEHYSVNFCEHHENEDEEDTSCDLCLLVLNLNSLDYNNSLEFSYESHIQITNNFGKDLLVHKKLYYGRLFSEHNRNKAPPHFI
ncbi:hypothetical protein [Winogradskyella sp.]|uniref:hypothetical protein n=1 Tax=Winogradskyella sp. TaxID=1883156 RepID=UPI003BA9FE63